MHSVSFSFQKTFDLFLLFFYAVRQWPLHACKRSFRTKPAWMQQQPFGYSAWPGMTPFGYPPTPPPHMMQPPVYYPPPFCAPGWGAPPPPPQVQQPCFDEDDSYSSEDDRPTRRRAPTPPAREKKRRNRDRQCDDDEDDSSFPPRKPERPVDLTQPEKDGDEKSRQSGSEQKKRNTSSSSGLDKKSEDVGFPPLPPSLAAAPVEMPKPKYVNCFSIGAYDAFGDDGCTATEADIKKMILEFKSVEVHAVIWCFDFERGKAKVRCCGENTKNIANCINQKPVLQQVLRDTRAAVELAFENRSLRECNVLFVCGHGRHRSVACAKIAHEVMARNGYWSSPPIHFSRSNWARMCSSCTSCTEDKEAKERLCERAQCLW